VTGSSTSTSGQDTQPFATLTPQTILMPSLNASLPINLTVTPTNFDSSLAFILIPQGAINSKFSIGLLVDAVAQNILDSSGLNTWGYTSSIDAPSYILSLIFNITILDPGQENLLKSATFGFAVESRQNDLCLG